MELIHKELSDKVIKAFYKVYNELGYGFLEKVYQNALYLELTSMGIQAKRNYQIEVFYLRHKVGVYYADILVENKIILELKASENIVDAHECQLVNYLKATDLEIGLLLNFGRKPQLSRKIFSNDRKSHI